MFRLFSSLSNRAVLAILLFIALASSGASLVVNMVNNVDTSPGWWTSWLQNFSTEMFGAFLAFLLLTLVVGNRQEKERLIRQMRSSVNNDVIRAVEVLREYGWLMDGSLQSALLMSANLQGVKLVEANLRGVHLQDGNLQGASLGYTNLRGAKLLGTNLQNANMEAAALQGANLHYANLEGVKLDRASFDESTFLPDGKRWTPETDMTRFTDPAHPQFWRSDYPDSRTYRGAKE